MEYPTGPAVGVALTAKALLSHCARLAKRSCSPNRTSQISDDEVRRSIEDTFYKKHTEETQKWYSASSPGNLPKELHRVLDLALQERMRQLRAAQAAKFRLEGALRAQQEKLRTAQDQYSGLIRRIYVSCLREIRKRRVVRTQHSDAGKLPFISRPVSQVSDDDGSLNQKINYNNNICNNSAAVLPFKKREILLPQRITILPVPPTPSSPVAMRLPRLSGERLQKWKREALKPPPRPPTKRPLAEKLSMTNIRLSASAVIHREVPEASFSRLNQSGGPFQRLPLSSSFSRLKSPTAFQNRSPLVVAAARRRENRPVGGV